MIEKIRFDNSQARSYRKRVEVLAFCSEDPICFHKSWGDQDIRKNGWVIVPLSETGEVTKNIYGCDGEAFFATYEPSPSKQPNRYRKKETIRAYQPGNPFQLDTVLPDGYVEVAGSRADSDNSWIVCAPGGEVYPIEDAEFRRTYVEVS